MTLLHFLILTLFITTTGWSVCGVLRLRNPEKSSLFEQFILTFLVGFAVCSILFFLMAIVGWFEIKILILIFSILPVFCIIRQILRSEKFGRPLGFLFYSLLLTFSCFGLNKLAKPYEALIQADDASIYIGAGFQLAKSGNLSYQDPLVSEMTQEERSQIFNNRLARDTTGDMIRFPGGVRLVNSKNGSVVFSFYHLFPVWLAFGILLFGEVSFLNVLTLFLALTLISLFLIARQLGGVLLAVSVPLVSFFFFPQLYFSLMPTSELIAQALFLSGVWIFFSGIKSNQPLSSPKQFMVGILWGALFLCRLETLFMLSISLIFLFTVMPAFARNWSQWRVLTLMLLFFALLALYYQIVREEYLYVLTSTKYLGNQSIVFIGVEFLTTAIQFVQKHALLGFLCFMCIMAIVLSGVWWRLRGNENYHPRLRAALGIFIIVTSYAAIFGHWATWPRFVKHVNWISIYFSPPILLTLCFGLIFYLCRIVQEKDRVALLILFILFSLPAIASLIRPLIIIDQPWGIRKFVPIVFPLFFLISLSGWLYYLKRIFVRRDYATNTAFFILIALLTISFASQSQFLLTKRLYDNMLAQLRNFSSVIPKDALIVVPESWAATHLQIPIAYITGHHAVVLPVQKVWNNRLQHSMNTFLTHQIEKRPVVVLMDSTWDRPVPLKQFNLNRLGKRTLSFEHVPRIGKMEFPGSSEKMYFDYMAFNLSQKPRMNDEEVIIPYDDANTTFVDFHGKENGFRWTQEKSMIKDLGFPINKALTIIVSTIPEQDVNKQDVEMRINDQIPAKLFKIQNGELFFHIDDGKLNEVRSVTITSKTFVPFEKGLNTDPRRLGICFTKLTLQRAK
jgi:hypothetical protein